MPAARLFFSEGGIEEAVEWVKSSKELSVEEKKNFFETLKDIINHIVDTVKEYVTNKNLTNSEKAVANMSLEDVQKLRKQFLSVLDDAIKNLEAGVEIEAQTKKSIEVTTDNRYVVVINDNAVKYVKNNSELMKIVKSNLKRFKKIRINKQNIIINRTTRNEATGSIYSKRIKKKHPDVFVDKMNALMHQYEVVYATTDYINEGVNHERKDDIVDFARGKVLLQINGKQYESDSLFAYTKNDIIEMYDIENLEPTSFSIKKENASQDIRHKDVSRVRRDTFSNINIPQSTEKSNTKKSLDVYSSEYDKAVAAGDEKTAQRYVDEAAMQWGAYSVDGKTPLKLYHGTPNGEFYKFDKNKIGSNTDSGLYGSGFYFSTKQNQSKQYATDNNGKVINAYLNIHNPLMLNDYSKSELADLLDMDESQFSFDYEDRIARPSYAWINRFTSAVEEKGFDGVVVKYSNGADEYVVFNPEQIKSADPITYDDNGEVIPLEERFTDSKDIRFSKDVVTGDEEANNAITVDMSDSERAEVLKGVNITITDDNSSEIDINIDDYDDIKSRIEKPLREKLDDLGVFKNYKSDAVDVDFEFTHKGFGKSLHSQIEYGGENTDFVRVVANLDQLLNDAVLIETHTDKGKGTPKEKNTVEQYYVLLGVLKDGKNIIPVQFEIEQYYDNDNRLYLVVAMTKIKEADVVEIATAQNGVEQSLLSASDISIVDIFKNINPKDNNFLKYVPDEFLNEEQKQAKAVAMTKIKEADVVESVVDGKTDIEHSLLSASDISIVNIFKKNNPKDNNFLKYVPDEFLNDEQKKAIP